MGKAKEVIRVDILDGMTVDDRVSDALLDSARALRFGTDHLAKLTGAARTVAESEEVARLADHATVVAAQSVATAQRRALAYLKLFVAFADRYGEMVKSPDAKSFKAAFDAFVSWRAELARAALVVQHGIDPASAAAKKPSGFGGVKSTISKAKKIVSSISESGPVTRDQVLECIANNGAGFDALYEACPKTSNRPPKPIALTEATPAQVAETVASAPKPFAYLKEILHSVLGRKELRAEAASVVLGMLNLAASEDEAVASMMTEYATAVVRAKAEADAQAEDDARAHTEAKRKRRAKRAEARAVVTK